MREEELSLPRECMCVAKGGDRIFLLCIKMILPKGVSYRHTYIYIYIKERERERERESE